MKPKLSALIAALLTALLGSARPLPAQDPAAPPPAAPHEIAVPDTPEAAAPDAGLEESERPPAIFEQSIYIPYEKLRRVFEK